MSNPIVFISTHKIKDGKLVDLRRFVSEGAPRIRKDKPGTTAFLGYINEAGTEIKFVHIFPDGQAMIAHFEGVQERSENAWEFLELQGHEVYGNAPEPLIQGLIQSTQEAGADLYLAPELAAGYMHLERG